jgi:hypothetical protein
LEFLVLHPDGPGDARELVGQRAGGLVVISALLHLERPGAQAIELWETEGEIASVVVSTLCTVHNAFGKLYLFVIIPFHRWGVRRLISRAVIAGRL